MAVVVRVVCHNFCFAVFDRPSVPSVGDSVVGYDVISDLVLCYSFWPVMSSLRRYDGLHGQLRVVVSLQVPISSLR
ncbi:MAG: hypothetical protein GY938_02615 [Ketobacter sp.]|nr:hypothetical protein [Ketobacter sp.]